MCGSDLRERVASLLRDALTFEPLALRERVGVQGGMFDRSFTRVARYRYILAQRSDCGLASARVGSGAIVIL